MRKVSRWIGTWETEGQSCQRMDRLQLWAWTPIALIWKDIKIPKQKEPIQNSLSKFARENCANYHGDNQCFGLNVRTLTDEAFRPPGDCYVVFGKRCSYFKRAVLGKRDTPYPHLCFVKDPEYENRVWDQWASIDLSAQQENKRRSCPMCDAPLMPRQRFCDTCKIKRRKKASQEYSRKHRAKSRGST